MLTPWFWTLAYRTVGKWIPSLLWWLQRANPEFCCKSIQTLYLSGRGRIPAIIVLEWAERVCLSKNILVTLIQTDLYMQKIPMQWKHYTSLIIDIFGSFLPTHTHLWKLISELVNSGSYIYSIWPCFTPKATACVPRGKGLLTPKANWSLSHSTLELKFKASGQFLLVA